MNRTRPASLILLLAAALAGCSSGRNFTPTPLASASPMATLSATSLNFGTIPLGQTSATQSVTLSNTGTLDSLNIASIKATGTNGAAFLTQNNCPPLLAKATSCTISVAFSPTSAAALSGTLTFTDDSTTSPQTVALTGTGSASGPVISLSSSTLSFATLPIGQASTQTVTLTNIGTGNLTLTGATLGGTNATSFAISGTCLTTGTVASSGTCFLTVTYSPTVAGSLSAQVNINSNAVNAPQTIALSTH